MRLVIVGAGGFGRETAAAVAASGPRWDLVGYADEAPALVGCEFEGARVLGPIDAVVAAHDGARVVICTARPGDHVTRRAIVERLDLPADRYATIVHPAASIAASAVLGHGTVVLAGVVATAQCRVGNHVAVMPSVTITHDDQVGDFATLASGVQLGGGVIVEEGAYLGAGCVVREGLTIGAWSLVGMGAVVTRDVPSGEVWAGVPARRLR